MNKPKYTRSKGQVLHRFEPGSVATTPTGTAEIVGHFARKQPKLSRDLREAVEQELRRWQHFDSQMQAFQSHTADLIPVNILSVKGYRLLNPIHLETWSFWRKSFTLVEVVDSDRVDQ